MVIIMIEEKFFNNTMKNIGTQKSSFGMGS